MEELSSKLALSLSFDGDQQKYFKFRNRILNFAAENNILNLVIEQPEFDRAMRVANRLVTIPAIYDKLGVIIQEARTEFVAFSDVDLFSEKTSDEINLLKANELTAYKINLESFLKRKSATIKLKDLVLEGLSPSVYNRLFSDQEFGTAFITLREIIRRLDSAYASIPECDVIAQERKLHNGKEPSQSFDDWISSFNIYFALQDKLGTSLTPTAKLNLFRESQFRKFHQDINRLMSVNVIKQKQLSLILVYLKRHITVEQRLVVIESTLTKKLDLKQLKWMSLKYFFKVQSLRGLGLLALISQHFFRILHFPLTIINIALSLLKIFLQQLSKNIIGKFTKLRDEFCLKFEQQCMV